MSTPNLPPALTHFLWGLEQIERAFTVRPGLCRWCHEPGTVDERGACEKSRCQETGDVHDKEP